MRRWLLGFLWLSVVHGVMEDDLVKSLPGLIFNTTFNTYSGYLRANNQGNWKMHYWLVESQSNSKTDPLLVWFNGGPGCSSFAGALEELGPFYVNADGETLYENVFAWNRFANVLFLESPIGVGFSYDTTNPNLTHHTDDITADQNHFALADFFVRVQPQYGTRPFFLTGESYAGHYIPQLTVRILNDPGFPNKKFMGIAIGNGEFSSQRQSNSIILWSFYHGRISLTDWDHAKKHCNGGNGTVDDIDQYNFFAYFKTNNNMDYFSDGSTCGNLLEEYLILPSDMDEYNFYQDCYSVFHTASNSHRRHKPRSKAKSRRVRRSALDPNTALTLNHDSTDSQWGYPCWDEDVVTKWANRRDVQEALHIDSAWQNQKTSGGDAYPWMDCNDNAIYNNYFNDYADTTQFFDQIIAKAEAVGLPNFRMLIYNGDVDTVCNYLGDAWHMKAIADKNGFKEAARQRWYYRKQTAGFVQRYSRNGLSIDVMTVKGSGHFVPNDRPGGALQMITNFVSLAANSSSDIDYNKAACALGRENYRSGRSTRMRKFPRRSTIDDPANRYYFLLMNNLNVDPETSFFLSPYKLERRGFWTVFYVPNALRIWAQREQDPRIRAGHLENPQEVIDRFPPLKKDSVPEIPDEIMRVFGNSPIHSGHINLVKQNEAEKLALKPLYSGREQPSPKSLEEVSSKRANTDESSRQLDEIQILLKKLIGNQTRRNSKSALQVKNSDPDGSSEKRSIITRNVPVAKAIPSGIF
ncbi:unnamed protein product, partial [Mesorhabditis spiculigera]